MNSVLKRVIKESDITGKLKSIGFQLFITSIILFAVLHVSYSLTLFEYPYDYQVGDLVQEDIVLSEDRVDQEATALNKQKAKYSVQEIYTIDPSVYARAKTGIGTFYNQAYDIKVEYTEEEEIGSRVFNYLLRGSFGLNQEELSILSKLSDEDLRLTENYIYDILRDIMRSGVTDENIIEKKKEVVAYFEGISEIQENVRPVITKIVDFHMVSNSHLDVAATDIAITKAENAVEDVVIEAGTVLAKAGDSLDERTYKIINELGLNDLHTFEQNIPLLSMDALVLLIIFVMYFVVKFYVTRTHKSVKMIYLNYLILILTYLLSFGLSSISVYFLPLATVGMLISIIDDYASGIVFSFFGILLFGVINAMPATIIALTMLGGMVSAIMVYRMHQRGKIFTAGLSVSLINAMMIFAHNFINQVGLQEGLEQVLFGILAGILCSILTIGSLPLWEVLFRVLTPLKLLELSNPNHALMKKLLLEAPGTYHHSILVANLSEAAVHDIGGNAILARVGAYFHDVGKLDRPYFYVENQFDNNPHDQMVPMVSAKVIKDHVTKGLEIGKQFKLPKEIISFIEEHHGTSLIKYFYHKACENSDAIDPLGYSYDGPTPQSKETAVVMLADCVEAAVRSMKQGDVKGLISKIIDDKIKSHQLDESGLTLGDIEIIKNSFYSNLSSAFHERIEYPDVEEKHINIIK